MVLLLKILVDSLMLGFCRLGVMFAAFQSFETVPWFMEAWKSKINAGVTSVAVSFSIFVETSSGQVALWGKFL